MRKPILCLDFDGVIHKYDSPWAGAAVIPDGIVPGVFEALLEYHEHFTLHIFSSRSKDPEGYHAMARWLLNCAMDYYGVEEHNKLPYDVADMLGSIEYPLTKPPAMITLDDRALTFTGEWPDVEILRAFKPWNKK